MGFSSSTDSGDTDLSQNGLYWFSLCFAFLGKQACNKKHVHHRVGLAGKPFAISEAYMFLSVPNMPEAFLISKISLL